MSDNKDKLRLDRFLAETTGVSRTQARRLLREQRLSINGQIIRSGHHIVTPQCQVLLDQQSLDWPVAQYLMLHKPAGMVCDRNSDFYPSVFELLAEHPRADKLHLAGRLDADTTGLLLVTDDGQWSHRITSPKHGCPKRYHAILEAPLSAEGKAEIESGLHLRSEKRPCEPAHIDMIEPLEIRITVTEGRYHLVKRLLAAVGAPVEQLHREAIGDLELDDQLAEGEWCELTLQQVRGFN